MPRGQCFGHGNVGRGELETSKVMAWTPLHRVVCKQLESSAQMAKAVNKQLHGLLWLGMNGSKQEPAGFYLHAKLLAELALETGLRGLAGFHFATRKLPESGKMPPRRTTGDQDVPASLQHTGRNQQGRGRSRGTIVSQLEVCLFPMSRRHRIMIKRRPLRNVMNGLMSRLMNCLGQVSTAFRLVQSA